MKTNIINPVIESGFLVQLLVQFYNILDGKHGLGLGLGLTLTLTLLGATGCAVLQHSGWETWVRVRVRVNPNPNPNPSWCNWLCSFTTFWMGNMG